MLALPTTVGQSHYTTGGRHEKLATENADMVATKAASMRARGRKTQARGALGRCQNR